MSKIHEYGLSTQNQCMKRRKIYDTLLHTRKNIRFNFLCRAAIRFGFELRGSKGSHHVFVRKDLPEILNFQNVYGKAKPYGGMQLCTKIGKYSLVEDEDNA